MQHTRLQQTGFPELSRRIALNPDYEAFIFRKFDLLSVRNLLHLESRLAHLEQRLEEADKKAAGSLDNETLRSIRNWAAFEENANDTDRDEREHMVIAKDINDVLKEYQEALLRQHQIATLASPRKRALKVVSHQFCQDRVDSSMISRAEKLLTGPPENKFDERNHPDLVAIRNPAEKDILTRTLQDHWIFKTTQVTEDVEHIKEHHVAWLAAIVTVIMAAILLIGAIALLYSQDKKKTQLGILAMFTALFAVSVGVLTNARRTEIFGATAAYAAVLVVFVSTTAVQCDERWKTSCIAEA